ncbi:DNA-3-methyladenine glycosylase 2 family protein [Solwaraspora sp. WMMD791]|uniref:DNA-3-methyladenine glycosylase family protein n=1 Tax=Solwaraspora sp. WMMD791 TaxID=3016086 RepID=UPI00249B7517|nr:DNA-3-methyladenine glycosylase 2 family protein [Solwaraspora sp. WMMD791]WFE27573.1 DNA-3-methyladenine glycosylase 2 family protein [Solwaraspora sp. WMMD791]
MVGHEQVGRSASRQRILRPPDGYHLAMSVRPLAMGRYDPCARWHADTFWWTARTPSGPAALALHRRGGELIATGHGPGAADVVDIADAVAGLRDDVDGFRALARHHPVVHALARRYAGVRLPATGAVFARVLRAVLEQKVTGVEAYRGYAATVRAFGTPAPGPAPGMWVTPDPAVIATTPYWKFHPLGIEQRRAQTLRRAAAVADRLEASVDASTATGRLTSLPGIGPWTAAEVVRVAFGAADAVSVGDFHLPNTVAWALAGEARGDDQRMLDLLEPFRGHRGRVCLLLELAGLAAPRFGPRAPLRSFARF